MSILACFLPSDSVLDPAELGTTGESGNEHQPNELAHQIHLVRKNPVNRPGVGLRGDTLVARARTANGEIPDLLLNLRRCRNCPTSLKIKKPAEAGFPKRR